ncbi:MAG: hypothetical protein ACYTFV_10530 [Planctomycetota bacterium]
MNRPFALSLFFGALPLVLGTAIFGAWVFTRNELWIAAGLGIMGLGTLIVPVAILCLVLGFDKFRKEARLTTGGIAWRVFGSLGLILVNFPAAFGLVIAAILLEERCVVVLTNETPFEARDWSLSWPGDEVHVQRWASGESQRFAFWCDGEGPIQLSIADLGGQPVEVTVEEYGGSGLGGRWEVTLLEGEEPRITWSAH